MNNNNTTIAALCLSSIFMLTEMIKFAGWKKIHFFLNFFPKDAKKNEFLDCI